MANHAGNEGTVTVGANAIAEIRSYSIEQGSDTVEDTTMGDTWRSRKPTLRTWSGTVEVYWDELDTTGQGAMEVGSEITLNVYPEGNTTGDNFYGGSCIVTGFNVTGSFDGMVEATLTVEGNGVLTRSDVV